ncbi:MAG: proton-conducting transporter membrane subunit, partial [Polyangiaceae bacterium]
MSAALLVVAAIALVAASGIVGPLLGTRSDGGERLSATLLIGGAALGLVGAVPQLWRDPVRAAGPWAVPGGALAIRIDGLAAMFLVQVFAIAGLGAIYALGYWSQREHPDGGRKLRCFYGLMTAGMALLVIADNAVLFLFGWEVMTISAFFCVTAEDTKEAVRQSGYVYLCTTRIGTLLLLGMFAVMHTATGSWSFEAPAHDLTAAAARAIGLLALGGFGLKAGLMPLHIWLPGAHANAPSHVSALMSGVLIKMGIYGLIRVASFFPHPPSSWGVVVMIAGGSSGVLGVAFAIGQHDVKRLLAYHSIENIGIIVLGLGVALLGRALDAPALVVLGLAGALLHVWNHGLFKALLFFSAGSVLHATATRQIDELGGLAKRMPYTAAAFLVGALAICGLPPLNGFVSELFVYLGLLHSMDTPRGWLAGALGVPTLALIGALALACFVKVVGAVFLGQPRTDRTERAHESPPVMLAPMFVLAVGCALVGLAPVAVAPAIDGAVAAWTGSDAGPTLASLAPLRMLVLTGLALAAVAAVLGVWLARRTEPTRTAT